jgi:hypothetical protein
MHIVEVVAEWLPLCGEKDRPEVGQECWGLITLALPPGSN